MPDNQTTKRPGGLLVLLGPGLLVAATGVGAGDLATGALTGSRLGVAVLWAVVLGAFIKYVLNEGLARWQLATGLTLLEGVAKHFGRVAIGLFLGYLCVWSLFVGSALMSACGVAAHAILPLLDASTDKIVYGILHSALAVALVRLGGYRLFERTMSICIGLMFLTVVASVIAVKPDWNAVFQGLFVPRIPNTDGHGLKWTVALMGGVGGTVTVLCYGYWIREEGRAGLAELKTCRIDLLTGYFMTAVFGLGMVILGSQLAVNDQARGATLVVDLASRLQVAFGAAGGVARVIFLLGAWGAVASSVLGVWQSVPYMFADCWSMLSPPGATAPEVNANSPMYRLSLIGIAVIPMVGLWYSFSQVQFLYALVGAAFMPILAVALLALNGSRRRVGEAAGNSWYTTAGLIAIVVFFFAAAALEISDSLN